MYHKIDNCIPKITNDSMKGQYKLIHLHEKALN